MPVEAQPRGKILIVGGSSSIGTALHPLPSKFAPTLTAGRTGCDIFLDLAAPLENLTLSENIDVIIHNAADFGGPSVEEMIEAGNINVIGTLKIYAADVRARAKHLTFTSSILSSLTGEAESYIKYPKKAAQLMLCIPYGETTNKT